MSIHILDKEGERERKTHKSATKRVPHFSHRASECVEFCTCFTGFLDFTLEAGDDVLKGEAGLVAARGTHGATHSTHS